MDTLDKLITEMIVKSGDIVRVLGEIVDLKDIEKFGSADTKLSWWRRRHGVLCRMRDSEMARIVTKMSKGQCSYRKENRENESGRKIYYLYVETTGSSEELMVIISDTELFEAWIVKKIEKMSKKNRNETMKKYKVWRLIQERERSIEKMIGVIGGIV
jgi:hypothetical protein